MDQILTYAMVAVAVVLLFGASIFVHEFGHYWVALRRKMRVEEFAIGCGPKVYSWTRNGVVYSWRLFPGPIGGYVKLPQMVTSDLAEGKSADENLPPAPPLSKILVAFAGPFMNVVFAFAIAAIIYFVGLPVLVNPSLIGNVDPDSAEARLGIRQGDRIVAVNGKPVKSWEEINQITVLARTNVFDVAIERAGIRTNYSLTARVHEGIGLKWLNLDPYDHPIVGAVEAGMPAQSAGLAKGDRFVSFDGVPVLSQEHLIELVRKSEGKESTVVVERSSQRVTLQVTPRYDPKTQRGRMGIVFAGGVYEVIRPGPTPWAQFAKVWERTIGVLGALVNSKQTGVRASDLSGPVGILSMLAVQVKTDYRLALDFLVLLNLNLAILNLLPIPVLDGGHIVESLIEAILRRPLNWRVVHYAKTAFFFVLISFMLYVTFFDFRRLSWFRALLQRDSQVEEVVPATPTNPPAPAPTSAP
ncbi:MAG TPA: RIP metalloprotease RseP [Verrucomicrobiota bacterium]|nr:RIP metalloprotease RseP [Verrucomicrobiota bacterium]HNU51402.1 RIP metalloprotease RseP [Verrucomicrobiota bacterium]